MIKKKLYQIKQQLLGLSTTIANIKRHKYNTTYCKYVEVATNKQIAVTYDTIFLSITQKISNPKSTVSEITTINTFSVGSVIKYFKIKQGKFVRRSWRGIKIFLNFLKNIFIKRYLNKQTSVFFNIRGCDFNLFKLNSLFCGFFEEIKNRRCFYLFNLVVSFTKKKDGRKKSIKKRLKKKMLKTFLQSLK